MVIQDEVLKETAKLVPIAEIYKDLIKPSATQVGTLAEDITKTLLLVATPLQFLAAYQDRLRSFIDSSIRQVPEEKRVSPAPQILGPILEGVKYEPEETPIYEMFRNLLSNATDADNQKKVHPAYPDMIRKLSSDEAIFLMVLREEQPFRTVEADLEKTLEGKLQFVRHRTIEDTFPIKKLSVPDRLNFYIDHINSMGLGGLYRVEDTALHADGEQTGTRHKSMYQLSALGQDFLDACMPAYV